MKRTICLFAHYNSKGKIFDYVLNYLFDLEKLGFTIVFISNSKLLTESIEKLKVKCPNCSIYERDNIGGDFGAWSWAINNGLLQTDFDYLLLANDSVFGPLYNLEEVITKMQAKLDIDFWGMTDSYQGGWHLQSYFLMFSKHVFQSKSFIQIFQQDFNTFVKKDIIIKGEILLSKKLSEEGFKGEAYIDYKILDSTDPKISSYNPTHFFWDKLIILYRFPFIKRELIFQNPENLVNLENLFFIINKYTDYNIKYIKDTFIESFSYSPVFHLDVNITVICHLYYPHSIFSFLAKLSTIKKFNTFFVFNISSTLFYYPDIIDVIEDLFPRAILLQTPDKGRDIGGKLSAFEAFTKTGLPSDFTLVIHDKFSPHVATGTQWRDELLRIIVETELVGILDIFKRNPSVGAIGSKNFIKNEYNPDKEAFDCTSSVILKQLIQKYNLSLDNFNYIAGTIFWIRSKILNDFFKHFSTSSVRRELESGNSLDFISGTVTHSWERLFTMIVTSQNFKIKGI